MAGQERLSWRQIYRRDRFLFLLVALLLNIGLVPFFKDYIALRLLANVLLSTIFLSAIFAVSRTRREWVTVTLVALPLLVLMWMTYWVPSAALILATHALTILFLLVAICRIFQFIFKAHEVTRNVVYAAVVIYLLIGVTWSDIYAVLEHLYPGSFKLSGSTITSGLYVYTYYSFVTLTTLGYGDLTPLTDQARSLAILEAVIGQLYVTVLIARLVGLHISHSSKKRNS
jgi:hypothetical protein